MFDAPMDGFVLWTGLGLVSLVVLGIALSLGGPPAPDAGAVADAIDRVGSSSYAAATTVPVEADAIRLGSARLALRRDGRTSHATFAAGSVTPVGDGQLRRVLEGESVRRTFETRRAFERALSRYPTRPLEWRQAPRQLQVRRVTWGEVDATLVG
jgi:hypothetical protein